MSHSAEALKWVDTPFGITLILFSKRGKFMSIRFFVNSDTVIIPFILGKSDLYIVL